MKTVLFIAILFSGVLFAQTQQYDVILVGADVGDMSVTRKVSGTKKTFLLESYTSVIFGTRNDAYTGKMEFENNVLISSSIENKKNGKLIFYTYVNKVGDAGYKVQTEKGLSTIAGKVGYCCYDIFFQEPKDGENLFSERWGKFGTISKTGDHDYKVEIKGAEDYIYHYEGGKMERMDVPSPVGKVKFVLK
jgi:hypothetical protein